MDFDPEGKDDLILKDSSIITRIIRAGKGEVILRSPSGIAHKYAFLSPRDTKDFPDGTIFAYIYHEGKRYYLGMMEPGPSPITFRRTARTSFNEDTDAMRGVRFIIKMANNQGLVDRTSMKLYQSGYCCKCGRILTSKSAIANGAGRECMDKLQLIEYAAPWDGNTVYNN